MSAGQGASWWRDPHYGWWVLLEPVTVPTTGGGTLQIHTREVGIVVHNATVHYDDCRPSPKRFRSTEEAKDYAMSTYLLEEP